MLTVYIYFTGWVYTYFYYKDFGVSLFSFDVPLGYFLMYSFEPLRTAKGLIILAVFVAVAALHAAGRVPRPALVFALLAPFPALFATALSSAHAVSHETRLHPIGKIVLAFKANEPGKVMQELEGYNKNEKLHLLLETKDRVTVYYQPGTIGGQLTAVRVFSVLRTDLSSTLTISD